MATASGIGATAALMLLAAACSAGVLQPDGSTNSAQPDAGSPPPGYFACWDVGAEVKVVFITNCDVDRGLVFVVPLVHYPGAPALPGLTLPADWALATGSVGDNMGICPSRRRSELQAGVTGTIEWARPGVAGSVFPSAVNVDVTLSFEPGDAALPASESIVARNLEVSDSCPP
jgi:hypothetical protein